MSAPSPHLLDASGWRGGYPNKAFPQLSIPLCLLANVEDSLSGGNGAKPVVCISSFRLPGR